MSRLNILYSSICNDVFGKGFSVFRNFSLFY